MYECDVAQAEEYGGLIAANVRAALARLEITQARAARRMRRLGFNWYQQTVGAVARGDRRVSADEIAALALCLETTPDVLTLPPPGVSVVLFGGERIPAQRFSIIDDSVSWEDDDLKVNAPTTQYRPVEMRAMVYAAREELRRQAAVQPVVAAIVTSPLGVLAGRRRDGKPPWTFIAGEQDAVQDESPEDTAVREVKEETGLRIVAGEVIGERVHPATGRTMVYIAATPTRGTEIFVGDEDELAEVRWLSLAEADELLPGMYEPVREYLEREIGGAER